MIHHACIVEAHDNTCIFSLEYSVFTVHACTYVGISADYYLMGSHARMCKAVLCGLESQSVGKDNKM